MKDKQSFSTNKIAVVLPMYNEQDNVSLIIKHLVLVAKKNNLDLSQITINDGSRDNTKSILLSLKKNYPKLHIVSYQKNRGMGGALKIGIKYALKKGFKILIFMDSDLSHDGKDIPKFLKKIQQGYDIVLGSRFIKGGRMEGVPPPRYLVSLVGNFAGRIILNTSVGDLTTGYRAVRSDVFKKITLDEDGFSIQLEETIKAITAGFKITEIPIVLSTRRFGNSKMVYSLDLVTRYLKLFKKCLRWRYLNNNRQK